MLVRTTRNWQLPVWQFFSTGKALNHLWTFKMSYFFLRKVLQYWYLMNIFLFRNSIPVHITFSSQRFCPLKTFLLWSCRKRHVSLSSLLGFVWVAFFSHRCALFKACDNLSLILTCISVPDFFKDWIYTTIGVFIYVPVNWAIHFVCVLIFLDSASLQLT